ncbi:MAG TPA: hypothetical protein EYP62_04595 [Kiritimatiellae bacterium]|nr:hypothetical protein [Kiritimatiellia bacterium]
MEEDLRASRIRGCALQRGTAAGLLALCCSCASIPEQYRPTRVGPNLPPEGAGGIEVQIRPLTASVRIGEPVLFDIVIYNRNGHAVALPRHPDIEMIWIYPDGQRDSTVHQPQGARFFDPEEVLLLPPGHALRTEISLPTYYFPGPGVTEFRAVLHAEENLNPRITNFWSGRAYSNSYGILVKPRTKRL